MFENVARAAAGFSAMGIGAEDAVAMMLRNDFPFFEASMAANFAGAHAVPRHTTKFVKRLNQKLKWE